MTLRHYDTHPVHRGEEKDVIFIAILSLCEDPEVHKFIENKMMDLQPSGELKKHCFHCSWSGCGMRSLETTPI